MFCFLNFKLDIVIWPIKTGWLNYICSV